MCRICAARAPLINDSLLLAIVPYNVHLELNQVLAAVHEMKDLLKEIKGIPLDLQARAVKAESVLQDELEYGPEELEKILYSDHGPRKDPAHT